jgi:hypothetical protein
MRFQDALEEATASAVVMPPALAALLLTRRIARWRHRIVTALAVDIEKAWVENTGGIWVRNLRNVRRSDLGDCAEVALAWFVCLFVLKLRKRRFHRMCGTRQGTTALYLLTKLHS